MKPYCFPDVHVEKQVTADSLKRKGCLFQPIGFDEKGNLYINPQDNMIYDYEALSNKKDQIKEIEENAYNDGFKKGEKDGLNSFSDRIEFVLCSLREAVTEIDKLKKNLLLSAEREAVELSLAVAKKIVCHEVSVNRDVVIKVVREAVKKVGDYKKVKIRLSPSDVSFIKEAKKTIPELEESLKGFLVEKDETIMSGGCLIETDMGDIDARIDKQLQIVEDVFKSQIDKLGRY
jgi:flagellar assembly protein FliH